MPERVCSRVYTIFTEDYCGPGILKIYISCEIALYVGFYIIKKNFWFLDTTRDLITFNLAKLYINGNFT